MATITYSPAQIAEAIHGPDDSEVKTRISEQAREAARLKARALGYRSLADFARDAIHVATFGAAAVQQCHAGRLKGVGQPWANSGLDSEFGSAL